MTDDAVKGLVMKAFVDDQSCSSVMNKIDITVDRREDVPATQFDDEDEEKFERRKTRRAKLASFVVRVKFDVPISSFMIPNSILPYLQKTYPGKKINVRTWTGLLPKEQKEKNENRQPHNNTDDFLVI